MMKYYLAPMEGLTTYVYRNAYHRFFHPMDKYFTPFIVPHIQKNFNAREWKELSPEHNAGMYVVPQILTNNSEDFVRTSRALEELGYEEVNLNLGCPSRTVVSKGRGSGFLSDPDQLDRFFEEVFSQLEMKISVKTRLGLEFPWEFPDLMKVYQRYPLEELIIHPRVQKDFYKNTPNLEMFAHGADNCSHPICYNGDLCSQEDIAELKKSFPQVDRIMLGRGILKNPGLLTALDQCEADTLHGRPDKETMRKFHDQICEGYQEICSGDRNVLFKMKEFWSYFIESWPEESRKKALKKIKKTEKLLIYRHVAEEVFSMYY